MKKQIISAILVITLLLPFVFILSNAEEVKNKDFGTGGAIEEKIKEIEKVYNSDSYFTVSGGPCCSNQCYDCQLSAIPARGNLQSGAEAAEKCYNAWSCCSFARYVFYNVFHCAAEDQTKVSHDELSYGDYIYLSGRHYAIYLGEDDEYWYVYHGNGDGQCGVEYMDALSKGTWSFSFGYHADNYDEVDGNMKKADMPKNISLENTNEGVKVSWDKVKGVSNYKVYKKTSKDLLIDDYKELTDVKGTSFIDTDVTSDSTYFYTVQSLNTKGDIISKYDIIGNSIYYVETPEIQTTYNESQNNATISWNMIDGAKEYEVYLYNNDINEYEKIDTTSSLFILQNNIEQGKEYSYKVKAISKAGSTSSLSETTNSTY